MRTKIIVLGIAVLLACAAWWVWQSGASDSSGAPGAVGVASDPSSQADRVGEPVHKSYNMLAQRLVGTSDPARLSVDERKTRMRGLFDAVRAVKQVVPRDTFDVNAVVEQVGREPAQLHSWVRTHTLWIPYRGALRGATGTLMDRAGNSLDRSLLLARLLEAAGVSARLSRAALSGDQAARLHQQNEQTSVATAAADAAALTDAVDAAIERYAKQAGLDAAPMRQQVRQTHELSRRAGEDVQQRVAAQTARLALDLGLSSMTATDAPADLDALRDHWWVQAQVGSAWTDLDPALTDAGASVVTAQQTVEPNSLPADLRHSVQVSVIVEQWNGATFTERRPVSIELRPSDVLGDILRLQHLPTVRPRDQSATPAADRQRRLKDIALAQREWLPVFTLGAKRVTQASVMDTGELNPQPGTKKRGPAGGYVDMFGGGSDPAANPAPVGVLTAEWIEYEIRAPGREPRIVRREVFDLVGGAARSAGRGPATLTDQLRLKRALGMLSETEILLLACQPSAAFIAHLMGSRLLENEPLLSSRVTAEPLPDGQAVLDSLRGVRPLPGTLHALAVARAQWSRAPGTVQLRQPNLLSRHMFLRQDAAGLVGMATAIDIVANEVAPRVGTPAEQFLARVEQGVLDANAEAALIGPAANGSTTADRYGVGNSAVRWVPVRSVEDLEKLAPPPDLRARLEADLRAGFVLLVPPAAPDAPATWWRINPATGDTLSFGDRGWGQAKAEYALVTGLGGIGAIVCSAVFVGLIGGGGTAGTLAFCAGAGLLAGGVGLMAGGTAIGVGWIVWAFGLAIMNLGFLAAW